MPRGWCDHRSMMKPVTYVLQFRGRAYRWPTRRTVAELSAPSTALVTMLGSDGVSAGYELSPGGEARLRSQVTVRGELLEAQSTVSFGDGHELRIRTVEPAHLVATPRPAPPAGQRRQRGDRGAPAVPRRPRADRLEPAHQQHRRGDRQPPRRDLRRGQTRRRSSTSRRLSILIVACFVAAAIAVTSALASTGGEPAQRGTTSPALPAPRAAAGDRPRTERAQQRRPRAASRHIARSRHPPGRGQPRSARTSWWTRRTRVAAWRPSSSRQTPDPDLPRPTRSRRRRSSTSLRRRRSRRSPAAAVAIRAPGASSRTDGPDGPSTWSSTSPSPGVVPSTRSAPAPGAPARRLYDPRVVDEIDEMFEYEVVPSVAVPAKPGGTPPARSGRRCARG